jgi:hypothetical protein
MVLNKVIGPVISSVKSADFGMRRFLNKYLVLLLPLSLAFAQPPSAGVTSVTNADLRVATAAAVNTVQTQAFPRIIAGSQWETTFVLVNPGSTPMSFRQSFLGANGTPQEFTLRNQSDGTELTTSQFTGTLNPGSSLSPVGWVSCRGI